MVCVPVVTSVISCIKKLVEIRAVNQDVANTIDMALLPKDLNPPKDLNDEKKWGVWSKKEDSPTDKRLRLST